MQNEQDKKSDIKLWDLVKNSTKKLKANNDYSSSPKKAVSKKSLSSSNQNILNSLNISSKKENFEFINVGDTNSKLNFINETNNGCGVKGLDFNSGWNCTPINQLWLGNSIISTKSVSGFLPHKTIPDLVNDSI